MAKVLSADNWQNAVLEAIEKLPDDIGASVGYRQDDAQNMVVIGACEPDGPGYDECSLSPVYLRYWSTLAECGWPEDVDGLYTGGGPYSVRVGWPVIWVFGMAAGVEEVAFVGHTPVVRFREMVQLAILDALFYGGGMNVVNKDSCGRFLRLDGTPILKWQFTKRNTRK